MCLFTSSGNIWSRFEKQTASGVTRRSFFIAGGKVRRVHVFPVSSICSEAWDLSGYANKDPEANYAIYLGHDQIFKLNMKLLQDA